MNKTYILVDFDGPLLASKSLYTPRNQLKFREADGINTKFDEFSVWAHNMWAKYGEATIIFSTNWCMHKTTEELKTICKNNGLEFNNRYADDDHILTQRKLTSGRGSEVWWTIGDMAEEGDRFLIVDDDTSCKYVDKYAQTAIDPDSNPAGYVNWSKMDTPPQVKWLEVDTTEGLSLQNFRDGANFLGFNEYGLETYTPWDYMNKNEFSKELKTKEEKEKLQKEMDILISCMI
jgi:hypothetical protein